MKIAFVGISHQTIVLAAFLINKKIEVSIFETDVKLIDKYKKKALFNLEPGINKILKKNYQFIKVTKDFKKLKNFTIIHFTQDINLDNKYAKDYKKFMNLKYLVIDCLRQKTHPSHFNLDDVLELNILFKPKRMILTNLHSDLDYDKLMNILPKNVKPAYDGLTLDF